jgi:hypothetical protein
VAITPQGMERKHNIFCLFFQMKTLSLRIGMGVRRNKNDISIEIIQMVYCPISNCGKDYFW